ncbi:unnamed protein product [Prorocentrum cordatum]|uniref:Uncharacterized protein n=1 Tax=Prorocentrum cordatum TaxID=2364126 RepID=A0ABN9RUR5_9DINO|nr:unnamed protein product [Polarella glacialis]
MGTAFRRHVMTVWPTSICKPYGPSQPVDGWQLGLCLQREVRLATGVAADVGIAGNITDCIALHHHLRRQLVRAAFDGVAVDVGLLLNARAGLTDDRVVAITALQYQLRDRGSESADDDRATLLRGAFSLSSIICVWLGRRWSMPSLIAVPIVPTSLWKEASGLAMRISSGAALKVVSATDAAASWLSMMFIR